MDVSRSGRIRKKNSKLADFESPDEIETVVQSKRPSKSVSMKSYVVDSTMPPDQLLAGDDDTFPDIDVEAPEEKNDMMAGRFEVIRELLEAYSKDDQGKIAKAQVSFTYFDFLVLIFHIFFF